MRKLATSLALGCVAVLAACSGPSDPTEGPAADADSAGGYSIVASTSVWGDLADAVVSDEGATVTSIIEGNSTDPHHFEPTAADLARGEAADMVVVGGGGYDAWLYDGLSQPEDKVVHALPLVKHSHDVAERAAVTKDLRFDHPLDISGNEHIWYDPQSLERVAGEIAEKATAAGLEADAAPVVEKLDGAEETLGSLRGVRVAQTEPIADYLIVHTELSEVTPEGYRHATVNEAEPAAADLAAFLALIEEGGLDLLVYNPQTSTDMTERIRAAAEEAGIAVVEITETPNKGTDFLDFYEDTVAGFADAVRGAA